MKTPIASLCSLGRSLSSTLTLFGVAIFLLCRTTDAASGTWLANPVDNNWNNPANWSSGTIPNGSDVATFATSDATAVSISSSIIVLDIQFDASADAFAITALPGVHVQFDNTGVLNFSATEQNFLALTDSSGAAGSYGFAGGIIIGPVVFTQQAQNTVGGTPASVGFAFGSAGAATFHNLGASLPGGIGGRTDFFFTDTSADQCTIINDGASANGGTGGATAFSQEKPDAGNAILIANGGTNAGGGGSFSFNDGSLGGTARLEVFGSGYMDMSSHSGVSLSIGSIEGDGQIYLGKATLIVGTNSLSTTFSGVLHPGGPSNRSGSGFLSKTGTGTLSLTGANLYTNGTTVTQGVLIVSNTAGSGTGSGPLNVNAGTLGGSGIIAGAVTVGTGSGTGAFLAPASGGTKQLILTIQSALTFNADSAYTYTFKAKQNKARSDKVIANGVAINSGAMLNLSGQTQGSLRQGLTLTVISNTSPNPISGTFSNLSDGAIVTVNGNNFQASYEGGDGNDLILTVVP